MISSKHIRVHAESEFGKMFRAELPNSSRLRKIYRNYTLVCADPVYPKTLILRERSFIEKLLGLN